MTSSSNNLFSLTLHLPFYEAANNPLCGKNSNISNSLELGMFVTTWIIYHILKLRTNIKLFNWSWYYIEINKWVILLNSGSRLATRHLVLGHKDGPRLAPLLRQGHRGHFPGQADPIQLLYGVWGRPFAADDVDVAADGAHLGPAAPRFD